MAEVRFDDIEAINALASEEFGEWGESIEVSQQMINDFAELTGDRQWIHIDVERSLKESPFAQVLLACNPSPLFALAFLLFCFCLT